MIAIILIGKITGTHGLRGDVKVIPLTDYPERYDSLKEVYVGDEQYYQSYQVASVKPHKSFYLFKFKGLEDIDAVKHLKNQFLLVNEEDAVKLPEDTYFIHDIIGLDVFLEDGQPLGKVKEVFHTGSNDVYVVSGAQGEKLIPAIKEVMTIDLSGKRVVVRNKPGLLENAEEV